ncbi:MAG TPA: ABC transporter ATP-binding protein [Terriglobales bacterium]|nr:ABC transporter ATP-binding protein [Terriglobales bacterium]
MAPILEVRDLHIAYPSRSGTPVRALAGVDFSLSSGEILGILGESGSGKSTLAAALLNLLPPQGRISRGSVCFEGIDLLAADEGRLREIRGARISLIHQEPSIALHPTMRVRAQVDEVVRAHLNTAGGTRRAKTDAALGAVFGSEAGSLGARYPHELSGGQRQRVLIAQAIACGPSILIADEPTASLDSVTQAGIFALFGELQRSLGLALILITHNPALLAGFAHRVLVLYAGGIAELGPAADVISQPKHPYTKALLDSLPPWPTPAASTTARLPMIPGDLPDLAAPSLACRFEPRCPVRMEVCNTREPAATALGPAHSVSCFKFGG